MNLEYKKIILRKIPNGLFITTAKEGTKATGTIIQFVSKISFDPPYIALAIRKDYNFYRVAENSENLAVHLQSKEHK